MASTQVVFGAGQVGSMLAGHLARAGHQVRLVSRTGKAAGTTGVTAVRGDALDAAFCRDVVAGSTVVYHCMNPKYDIAAWTTMLPPLMDNLIGACSRADARLVVLENLYALGRPDGHALDEQRPLAPCSRKGAVRARLAATLFDAHRRGDVRAVMGQASDFFGPRGTQTMFEQRFWTRVFAGKSGQVIVNPDVPHTYHYIPDVAAGLASLGSAPDDVTGRTWMLPCDAAGSTRALIGRFAAHVGHEIAVQRVPGALVALMGLFTPIIREFREMQYQWEEPFVVDDSAFRARFDARPTPIDDAARDTVTWAKATFGPSAGR